jgi:hypothetical protein
MLHFLDKKVKNNTNSNEINNLFYLSDLESAPNLKTKKYLGNIRHYPSANQE